MNWWGRVVFFFPAWVIPSWFNYQASGSSLTIQLPSHGASSEFFGFILYATVGPFDNSVGFVDFSGGFQVKCRYVFRNNDGDIREFHGYLGGCYPGKGKQLIFQDHLLFGYDPCLGASEDIWCGRYTEVLIEFCPEDMNSNPLCSCLVIECGVSLYTQHEKYSDDLAIAGPVDQVRIFQANFSDFRELVMKMTGRTSERNSEALQLSSDASACMVKRQHDDDDDMKNERETNSGNLQGQERCSKRIKLMDGNSASLYDKPPILHVYSRRNKQEKKK